MGDVIKIFWHVYITNFKKEEITLYKGHIDMTLSATWKKL